MRWPVSGLFAACAKGAQHSGSAYVFLKRLKSVSAISACVCKGGKTCVSVSPLSLLSCLLASHFVEVAGHWPACPLAMLVPLTFLTWKLPGRCSVHEYCSADDHLAPASLPSSAPTRRLVCTDRTARTCNCPNADTSWLSCWMGVRSNLSKMQKPILSVDSNKDECISKGCHIEGQPH
jgi:hypothetical protein